MIKALIRNSLRSAGYEIHRCTPMGHLSAFEAQQVILDGTVVESIVDVGANDGRVSERYRRLFPEARVLACEPTPETYDELQRRASADEKLVALRTALSDKEGTAILHLNRDRDTNSLLQTAENIGVHSPWLISRTSTEATVEVPVTTLDSLCRELNVPRLSILKIDVQGAELRVLGGGRRLLSRGAIDLIYTEVLFAPHYEGQAFFENIAAALAEFQYRLFRLYNLKYTSAGALSWGDAIFLSPRVALSLVDCNS